MMTRELPEALRVAQVDLLLVDQVVPGGGTVAEFLEMPFVTVCCALATHGLVVVLGNRQSNANLDLPGSPLVVAYAPQLELLKRASLTITHAGLNTVLESLANGVPMVAIPITNDQPGVAARLRWTGAGEVVPFASLRVSRLRSAIQKVLTQESYRQNAAKLQSAIQRAGGGSLAADIIEQVIG